MSQLAALHDVVESTPTVECVGRVVRACGTVIHVTGLETRVGALCRLYDADSAWSLHAEVVGLAGDRAILTPLGSLRGMSTGTRVVALGEQQSVPVGDAVLGRVIDAHGMPLDDRGPLDVSDRAPLHRAPPPPMRRRPIEDIAPTGVRVIDSLLTCGVGQRTGVFATAGGGKSTLLGMLARGSRADVNVVALIGERGREVSEFIRDSLGDALERSVVVVATSDRPPPERARAAYVAMAIAEYFRDRGQHVQMLIDSVTRYARALRDIGLAAGEPPTRRGFPPSVFTVLPQFFERAGNNEHGAISAFYTVLVEDEESTDPVTEEVRSLLDGHICLSRALAAENHYPAIDVLTSASRLMNILASKEHRALAGDARALLAKHRSVEPLVQLGEYEPGADELADRAIERAPALSAHLCQDAEEGAEFDQTLASLARACGT